MKNIFLILLVILFASCSNSIEDDKIQEQNYSYLDKFYEEYKQNTTFESDKNTTNPNERDGDNSDEGNQGNSDERDEDNSNEGNQDNSDEENEDNPDERDEDNSNEGNQDNSDEENEDNPDEENEDNPDEENEDNPNEENEDNPNEENEDNPDEENEDNPDEENEDNPDNQNTTNPETVYKPTGIFASSGAKSNSIYANPETKGVLIRGIWEDIESSPGIYDFSYINSQVEVVESRGLNWSLAVSTGINSPPWLINEMEVDYLDISFRGEPAKVPKWWDDKVKTRLELLAQELGKEFGDNDNLALVYVSQMTSNGIEGHFNGVNSDYLISQGLNQDSWFNSLKNTTYAFAEAFPNKALAIEYHDLLGNSDIAEYSMYAMLEDEHLEGRVGAAIWWISGGTSYQPELLTILSEFPGDKYGQIIARSDQTHRFDNGYEAVFSQAQELGLRYIEPWEYDIKNLSKISLFQSFNNYTKTNFN